MAAWIENRGATITVRWKFRGKFGRRKVPDKKTARLLVKEIEACHAFGRHYRPRAVETRQDLDLIDVAAEHIKELRRLRSDKTVANTRTALKRFLAFLRHVKPRGRLTPDLITRKALDGFHDHLIDEGRAPTTARHYVTRAAMFWQWSERSEIYGDEFDRFNPPRLPSLPSSAVVSCPSWAQIDEVIEAEAIRAPGCPGLRLMTIQRYTGLRVKQAGRLLWSDVDIDGRRLRVRPALGKSALEKRGRVIPITEHLADALAGWGRRDGAIIDADGRDERLHLESVRKSNVRAWCRSAVDPAMYQGQTSHLYRKAFTSELVRRGAERFAVEMLLGRSTGLGGDVYTDPAFTWGAMKAAVNLVTKIGAEKAVDFHQRVGW